MKKMKFLILLVGFLAFNSLGAGAGQITHTVTYDPSMLSVTYDTIEGISYAKVEYNGLKSHNHAGLPELPFDVIMLSVPYNATNFTVQYEEKDSYEISISSIVYPAQEPRIINDTTDFEFTQPNSIIYRSSSFYPTFQKENVVYGYLYGSNKIVSIDLRPILYNPSNGKLKLLTEVEVIVNYSINSNIVPQIYRNESTIKQLEQDMTALCVRNGADVTNNSFVSTNLPTINQGRNSETLPTYNYCIITNRELEPAFKKIIAMKRQKGISAGTVCIEDLMSSSICNIGDVNLDEFGDTISVIADSAGVVRQYLKYAYNNNTTPTKYLLMGGKAPFAPVRFAKSYPNSYPTHQHVPTDMYFSDLTMPWIYINSNFDNVFQSEYIVPNVDYNKESLPYNPDLFVGRLLCSNQEELDNYSNKLHTYVFNPGKEDRTYLSNALVASSNLLRSMAIRFMNKVNGLLNITHIDNKDYSYLTGAQHIDSINQIKPGYVSFYGHGEPQSIEMFNDGDIRYVISALDRYLPDTIGFTDETTINENGNGLDNLTNKYYPFICYSTSCVTMPFDTVKYDFNVFTTYERDYNFGQSFTLGKNYGGPAYLGNTRMGYTYNSEYLEGDFVSAVFDDNYFSIGKAEAFSKIAFKERGTKLSNHVILEHNLLGDPEFEMWTSEPQQYEGINVRHFGANYMINGATSSDIISYCDNEGNVGSFHGSDDFGFILNLSPSAIVMIYDHEHIPYIVPLLLQNCDINNSQYVYTSSFGAGKSVLPNTTNGNVTIKNGAVYEIEATDDVLLGEGFIVENGAIFAIKTPGKVTIDGCVFQSGAKVKIEAGNVEFVGKFTAELGSIVEFTQFVD